MTRTRNRYPRIPCIVPFCGCGATCYAPHEAAEIICPKHYRLVDRALKAKRRRLRAIYKRLGSTPRPRGRPNWRWRAARMEAHLWAKMKAQAIERATGVSA